VSARARVYARVCVPRDGSFFPLGMAGAYACTHTLKRREAAAICAPRKVHTTQRSVFFSPLFPRRFWKSRAPVKNHPKIRAYVHPPSVEIADVESGQKRVMAARARAGKSPERREESEVSREANEYLECARGARPTSRSTFRSKQKGIRKIIQRGGRKGGRDGERRENETKERKKERKEKKRGKKTEKSERRYSSVRRG